MTSNSNRGGNFLLGLALSAGLIIAAFIVSDTIKTVKLQNQTIEVKGYAEKKITSNLAIWTASIQRYSSDQTYAYSMLESDMERVIQFLESKGISRNDIDLSSVNSRTQFKLNEKGYSTNIIDGYSLDQTVTIQSENVEKIAEISTQSSVLLKEGLDFNSYSPRFLYTKLDDLKIEMLGAATEDAKNRAVQLAEKSGSKVGALKSARQGVFQITPANSTEISDYGMYDVSSIEKTIKAVVTIEYSIK
jgi:hypothetical protein